jgi:hypothetical protein
MNCERCGLLISKGSATLRTRSVPLDHRHTKTVRLVLCPDCAREYDSTGRQLVWGGVLFLGTALVLILASRLLGLP